jgi:hypothetical protein
MPKKKKSSLTLKNKQVVAIPFHGVTVRLPADIALSIESLNAEVHATSERIIRDAQRRRDQPIKSASSPSISEDETKKLKALAIIATNTWRAERRILNPETREPKEGMQLIHRDINAIREVLEKQLGLEIKDPIGQTYDSGSALNVVASEPMAGINKDIIKETIKPTILWNGQFLQIGEVIVGTPQIQ